jgi:LysR family transcriptional regulator, cyn operon transcriptional activator
MNLQQLRYLIATADEGTMTRAAESLHVAQPALSRAIRSLESEIGVTVFERKGRGVKVSRHGEEVIASARRILAEVDRLASLGRQQVLRVSAILGQAHEVASPAIAAYVTGEHGRVALDVTDTSQEVVDQVRDGRAHLGVIELPAPADLWVASLGWQEMLLIHPPGWTIEDPLDVSILSTLPLLSPGSDNWRHAALDTNLRTLGITPNITAETSQRDMITSLVVQGAGAWFSYGRQAQAAIDHGAGVVHLSPPAVREIGIVAIDEPTGSASTFVELARVETAATLLPVGDDRLVDATWISGGEILGTSPPPTSVRSSRYQP